MGVLLAFSRGVDWMGEKFGRLADWRQGLIQLRVITLAAALLGVAAWYLHRNADALDRIARMPLVAGLGAGMDWLVVGIAMLLLIVLRIYLHKHGQLCATSESGVHYWGAIYIPVVVAMAMQQNVVAALKGGPVALLAAVGSVVLCGLFVSFINRMELGTADEEGAK